MTRGLLLGGLLACLLATAALGESVLRLDSLQWTLTNGNGSISLNTTVPAYSIEVLRSNGVIGDPLYRYGEQESRWVAYEVWNFSTTFSAQDAAKLASQEQVVLFLGGVDTFGTVILNGETVLQTNNFHRHWTVPVKDSLDPTGPNTLTISISPAYNTTLQAQQEYPYHIPTLYNTGSIGAYNFARKPAFDFGWDWGPAFAASGIHGTVKLVAFSKPTLAGGYLAQKADNDSFNLKVLSQFLVPDSGGYGTLRVSLPELNLVAEQDVQFRGGYGNSADLFEAATYIAVPKSEVELWWPAGGNYGPHTLYNVTIEFQPLGAWCSAVPERGQQIPGLGGSLGSALFPGSGFGINLDFANGFRAGINIGDLFDFNIQVPGVSAPTTGSPDLPRGPSTNPAAGPPSAVVDGSQCSYIKKRIGFRTVELITDPLPKAKKDLFGDNPGLRFSANPWQIDSLLQRNEGWQWALDQDGQWRYFPGNNSNVEGAEGESYYFKVNGIPIYLKGANVIPMNIFPANVTKQLIRSTLQAAVESNQNLLRVWGGGSYHPEEFYDFCDEHGILVWQDAMFGGSHYPRNPEWLANIEEEITQQAERLSWHPSVALWCGNNELELSYEWANNTRVRSNRNMFVTDYMANIMTLRKAIKKVNPSNIFVSSSPTKGTIADSPEEYILRWGWIGDTRYGSIHHYDYMSDCENFRSYPPAKFVTEFGWQSYPMPETYAAAMQPEIDWGVGNPMNEFRNRRTDVTPQFLYQYGLHFKLPKDWNPADPAERMDRFKSYLWIGHMQHARCYETALNFWRRLRSHPTSLTMGVMYWQLNDIWAGASWSSVDVQGRWKPVHYSVKRAFAPLAIQAIRDNNTIDIFVVSDLLEKTDARIKLQLVSLSDTADSCSAELRQAQDIITFTAPVAGNFASRVWSSSLDALLAMRPGCTNTTCFLTATAEADGVAATESQLWFVPFKFIDFSNPELQIESIKQAASDSVNITVTAKRPAALVLVSEVAPLLGHYNDNVFSINPCEPRVVTFVSQNGPVATEDLTDGSFYVESLYDHSSWENDVAAPSHASTDATGSSSSNAATTEQPQQQQTIAQQVAAVEHEDEHPGELPHTAVADSVQPVFVAPGQTHEEVKAQQQQQQGTELVKTSEPAAAEAQPAKDMEAEVPAAPAATEPVAAEPPAAAATATADMPTAAAQQLNVANLKSSAEADKNADSDADAQADSEADSDADAEADAETDSGSKTGPQIEEQLIAPEDMHIGNIVAASERRETARIPIV